MKSVVSPLNTTKETTASSLLTPPAHGKGANSKSGLVLSFTSETANPNTSLSQLGALSWTHCASGGKFRSAAGKARKLVPTTEPKSHWNPFLGYIGPSSSRSRAGLIDGSYTRLKLLGSVEGPRGQCFKLEKRAHLETQDSVQRALLYLKLREDGCSKSKSLVFTRKRKCMFDSTLRKDGPSCHRTISLGDNRVLGPNWNGWQLHSPKLLVHRKFQSADMSLDHREYEMLTQEFERLSTLSQLQSDGIDFEEIDQSRERYFATLSKEWSRREAGHKRSAKSEHSDLTVTIPEESTPDLPMPDVPLHFSRLPTSTVQPEAEVVDAPQRERAARKPTFKPVATWLDRTKVSKFGKSSLVFRSMPPSKASREKLTQIGPLSTRQRGAGALFPNSKRKSQTSSAEGLKLPAVEAKD